MEFGREGVQAHVVDRVGYVASFAQKAQEAGARYLLGHRVTDVSVDNGCAAVKVTDDVETRTMRGKVLVVASGFGSELTGQLGLGRVGDYVTGVQAEVMAPQIKDIHVYVGRQVAPGFFAWVVPTWGGRALVGLLSRQRGHGYLEKLLARLQMEGKVEGITKSPARWGIPLRPLGRTYGERVVVVGDAAGQVKPTTGGGIYYALRASEIAAETLHQALGHMDLSASRLKQYERGWRALLSQELELEYSARRGAVEGLPDRLRHSYGGQQRDLQGAGGIPDPVLRLAQRGGDEGVGTPGPGQGPDIPQPPSRRHWPPKIGATARAAPAGTQFSSKSDTILVFIPTILLVQFPQIHHMVEGWKNARG